MVVELLLRCRIGWRGNCMLVALCLCLSANLRGALGGAWAKLQCPFDNPVVSYFRIKVSSLSGLLGSLTACSIPDLALAPGSIRKMVCHILLLVNCGKMKMVENVRSTG